MQNSIRLGQKSSI